MCLIVVNAFPFFFFLPYNFLGFTTLNIAPTKAIPYLRSLLLLSSVFSHSAATSGQNAGTPEMSTFP